MAYDLSYLRNRVMEDKLDDLSYDPTIIDRFINDAIRAISTAYELPEFEKTFSGLLPVSEYIFNFPSDYETQQSLKLTDPLGNRRDLSKLYIPFRDFDNRFPTPLNNNPGAPGMWTLHGNKMYLDKPTDQNYSLELRYIKVPTKLEADADVPELGEEWEEVIVLGAYYRALARNEDFDLSAYIKNNDYTDELDKVARRATRRQSGTPHRMGQPQSQAGRFAGRHRR